MRRFIRETEREARNREYREMMWANATMAFWMLLFTAILCGLAAAML